MAEEHRRVEPRAIITGTGMTTDPERVESIQADYARAERAWRTPPKKKFGEVLGENQTARAKALLVDDAEEQAKREASEKRAHDERQTIRRIMGQGSVHPGHAEGKHKVSLKG
ncbi:MAG: hypothetical protein ABIJ09_14120 [Pseudomonadota bacterium]